MPKIPRFVQSNLAIGVPSGQAQGRGQDAQESRDFQNALRSVAQVNLQVAEFKNRQFMTTNSVKLDNTVRDMASTWQRQNISNPESNKDNFVKAVNARVDKMIEGAPNSIASRNFRERANQQINRAVGNLDAWGKAQNIRNLLDDTNTEAEKLSVQARLGANVDDLNENLSELSLGLKGSVSDEKLEIFEAEHRSEIFYRHGLNRIEQNPLAGDALLANKNFTDNLKVEHLESLKRSTARQKTTNQNSLLRDQILFNEKPTEFMIRKGQINVLDWSKPSSQIATDFRSRNEQIDLSDPLQVKDRLGDQEVGVLLSSYNGVNDNNKLQLLNTFSEVTSSSGKKIEDLVGIQVYKKDKAAGSALAYIKTNPDVSRKIIAGNSFIKTGNIDNEEMKKFRTNFEDYLSDINMNNVMKDRMEVGVKSMYAFNLKNRNLKNRDNINASFREMFGDKVTVGSRKIFPFRLQGTGNFATENEMDFVIDNLNQEVLDRHNIAPTAVGKQKVLIEDLRKGDITLQPAKQNSYIILVNGEALVNKTGGKAIFDFSSLFQEFLKNRGEVTQEAEAGFGLESL